MTGLIGGIQRFSTSDGPGIRTTVFLKGCPLRCQWCHNPELISSKQQLVQSQTKCIGCGVCQSVCPNQAIVATATGFQINRNLCTNCLDCVSVCAAQSLQPAGLVRTPQEVFETALHDRGFYEKSGGGLTISGGELLSQPDFAHALLDLAQLHQISTCLDTSGFGDQHQLLSMAEKADWILYDMKSIDDTIHQQYTGVSNRIILSNLDMLCRCGHVQKIFLRMPLIQGVNDSPAIIQNTVEFCLSHHIKQVSLLPYHQLGIQKCYNVGVIPHFLHPPTPERLTEIQSTFAHADIVAEILGAEIL